MLELSNVSVELGGRPIVRDVTLSVQAGEMLGIIGPNGGGKSTLLKAILGLLPYRGTITLADNVRIGYVPQYFDFDRTLPLTVRELFAVRFGGLVFGRGAVEHVREHLTAVGAEHTLHRRLGILSGGELQRVLIALALASNPDLLILDEPSSSLDVAGERAIYELITRLAKQHKLTVVFVSHDIEVMHEFAGRAICINQTIACDGVPHQVLTPEVLAKAHERAPVVQHHAGHAVPPALEEDHRG